MKILIQSLILFFGLQTFAATDLQPTIVLDSDTVLDQPRDGKVFYQTGKDVSFFDLTTKQTVTGSCNLDIAKKYQSRISVLEKGIYLVYRMVNATPGQYRILTENGSCWSIYEGYNFNFITKDPESGLWITGLDDRLVFIDVKTGKVVNSVVFYQGPFPRGSSLAKIIDNKLFIFNGDVWPTWDYLRAFDLKTMKEGESKYFSKPIVYAFSHESKLFFKDYSNNIYKFDDKNIEDSLLKPEFALHKDCTWFNFEAKNKLFLCEQTGNWNYLFSLQYMGSAEVVYPWGNEGGDYAIYSAERNLALKSKGSELNAYSLLDQTSVKIKLDSRVVGLLTSKRGEPYIGTDDGVYSLDPQGKVIQLFQFKGFETSDYETDPYVITQDNLLVYRVPNYDNQKVAIYSVKVK